MSEPARRGAARVPAGLRLEAIDKTFRQGGKALEVLHGVSLEVRPGELVALVGPSGSGKSTLLHIAGLLERADAGEVMVGGQTASLLDDNARTALRRNTIGFVYQYHHLLPEFSALENVVLPQMIAGLAKAEARVRAAELLGLVGLTERAEHRPARLSGGEQQRVAIARGLANAPAILFADEPTGNLDPHTADGVFDLLVKLVRGAGLAALIATHNLDLAARMDRTLRLEDGHIA
jgi:lipoprotein-releasing system ATP-binding protein